MTISALNGYTYKDIEIKHRHPNADVKFHVEKTINILIKTCKLNYDLLTADPSADDERCIDCDKDYNCPYSCPYGIARRSKPIHELRSDHIFLIEKLQEREKSFLISF